METRVALISIIVSDKDSVPPLNALLHEYRDFIVGRMGIPYKPKDICIISIALDAPHDTISAIAGKIGRLSGVATKTTYSNK